jgi:hypothetical protein
MITALDVRSSIVCGEGVPGTHPTFYPASGKFPFLGIKMPKREVGQLILCNTKINK